MADRRPLISTSGTNRILKSVRPASLTNIDRDAFARGIDKCIDLYGEAKKYHTQKFEASQERQLKIVLSRAERLQQLMKDESVWDNNLWERHCDAAERAPASPRIAMQEVVRLVKAELRDREFNFGQAYYRGTFRLRSPFEWLFGDWLVLVYQEAHFPDGESLKDLVSKNGPYLRFAKAVAQELKIRRHGRPYATASYIKAIKNVSSPKISRRKAWYERQLLPGGGNARFFEQGPWVLRDYLRSTMTSPREGGAGQN